MPCPLALRADGFVDPCIPTLADKPPSRPDWAHEAVVCGPDGIALFDAGALTLFGLTRWGKVFWPRHRVSHQWCASNFGGYNFALFRDFVVHFALDPTLRGDLNGRDAVEQIVGLSLVASGFCGAEGGAMQLPHPEL
jgi:hypothetical protein